MVNPQAAPDRRPAALAGADDAELVRRAQLGSGTAFEELVVRHGARLHRYLHIELRHESDAHDALQETLTAAWRGLPALRDTARFWPWLLGIAANKAADVRRRRARERTSERSEHASPDDLLLEAREALAALPHPQREALLLRYLLGLTEDETAAALGVRVGTVKSRCARGRRALLEALA